MVKLKSRRHTYTNQDLVPRVRLSLTKRIAASRNKITHKPTAWQVPNACAQPYRLGSGSHGHRAQKELLVTMNAVKFDR